MRIVIVALAVMSVSMSTAASAQTTASGASPECWPSSHIDKVVVEMADGTKKTGSLLCLGSEMLTLAQKQAIQPLRLDDVRRIRKAPDPVWDGAAKGASIGLVMLVLCGGHCSGEALLRTTAAYGLFGAALDAIDSHADTIYRPAAGRRVAAGFRVKF